MKRTFMAVATIVLLAGFSTGCRNVPSHAPTYDERRALRFITFVQPNAIEKWLQSDEMKKLTALVEAMRFTPEEQWRILDRGDDRLLAALVVTTEKDSPVAPEILRLARSRALDNPALLAALAYRQLRDCYDDETKELDFLATLKQWQKLEPANSVPFYLEASWWVKVDKFDAATRSLAEAAGIPASTRIARPCAWTLLARPITFAIPGTLRAFSPSPFSERFNCHSA